MRDAEHAIRAFFEILSNHVRGKLRRLMHIARQWAIMKHAQHGVRVASERIDELFARRLVVPLALRLARARVVIVAFQHGAQLHNESIARNSQQTPDRRANHRHRVLRRNGVIQRRRIQHALASNQPRRFRDLEHGLENAVRTR